MTIKAWLAFFKKYQENEILSISLLKLLTGMKEHSLRVSLTRLGEGNVIRRISRGYYANPFRQPDLETISCELCKPSYVSLESALARHGILSQLSTVLTCVTTQLPRELKTSFGTIQYRQIKRELFFGFGKVDRWFLAEPEKAVLDLFYLNKKNLSPTRTDEWDVSLLKNGKLRQYAKRMRLTKMNLTF